MGNEARNSQIMFFDVFHVVAGDKENNAEETDGIANLRDEWG
jgi:hypothetical protein